MVLYTFTGQVTLVLKQRESLFRVKFTHGLTASTHGLINEVPGLKRSDSTSCNFKETTRANKTASKQSSAGFSFPSIRFHFMHVLCLRVTWLAYAEPHFHFRDI